MDASHCGLVLTRQGPVVWASGREETRLSAAVRPGRGRDGATEARDSGPTGSKTGSQHRRSRRKAFSRIGRNCDRLDRTHRPNL